jgi:hypothetical protein
MSEYQYYEWQILDRPLTPKSGRREIPESLAELGQHNTESTEVTDGAACSVASVAASVSCGCGRARRVWRSWDDGIWNFT